MRQRTPGKRESRQAPPESASNPFRQGCGPLPRREQAARGHEVAKSLEAALGEAEAVKLGWKPSTEVTVTGDDAATLMKLIDALEEDDDVQSVWGNYDVPDEELEKLG